MIDGAALLAYCRDLSDQELVEQLKSAADRERLETVRSLARLAELRRRGLYQETGYSSLFMYCVKELLYCEGTAFNRTKIAEASLKFPRLLELIATGDLSVRNAALLSDQLTEENQACLIAGAIGRSRREVEALVAGLNPTSKPPERSRTIAVFASPVVSVSSDEAGPGLSLPEREQVQLRVEHTFSFSEEAENKLKRAKELLSHRYPMGDIEPILERALEALLSEIESERSPEKPRPDAAPRPREKQTRRIPAWVQRKVRARDGDRCAYVSAEGLRCEETKFLQFDHIQPWSKGGSSDDPANIRQACGSHNRWLYERMAGLEVGP